MAIFDAPQSLKIVIADLNTRRRIENGRVSITKDSFTDDTETLISTFLKLPRGMTFDDAARVVRKALFSSKLPEGFSLEDLATHCRDVYHEKQRANKNKYRIVTHFTVSGSFPFPEYSDDLAGVNVQLGTSDLIPAHVDAVLNKFGESATQADVAHGLPVIASIQAIDAREAFVLARRSLDKLRGAVNLAENMSVHGRTTFAGEQRALNRILNSKYSTVHAGNEDASSSIVWYSRSWVSPSKLYTFENAADHIGKRTTRILDRLRASHGLSHLADEGIVRYCAALDEPDWQHSFLALWSVLEFLCGVQPNQSHDIICARVCTLYSDKDLTKLYLDHLRQRRNRLIHSGYQIEEEFAEAILFQLNRYVSRMLYLIVENHFDFKNAEEWRDFLDLGISVAELQRRRRLINNAIQFQRPRRLDN